MCVGKLRKQNGQWAVWRNESAQCTSQNIGIDICVHSCQGMSQGI
jgi:hypothetical protein